MRNAWRIIGGALAALALGPGLAHAQNEPWEARLRLVYLYPANGSDSYGPLGIPSNAIHVSHRWLPDVDLEYRFTPYWSSELVLTYPQLEHVTVMHSALGGPVEIGTFEALPPTLTLKYNFLPEDRFQPYVGAGVNLTFISKVDLAVPTVGALSLAKTSVGPAVQAGFDYELSGNWYLNADLKWAMIRSDVKFRGVKISEARIDPLLFGVGFGYRFGGG